MASMVERVWDDVLADVRHAVERVVDGFQQGREQRQELDRQVAELTANSGGRFRIEPDQIPQVIADLDEALMRLQLIRGRADAIANTTPPGHDEVSRNAVLQVGEMAMGADGSLRAALDAYEEEITKTIAGLETDLKTYLGIEQINVPPASAWPSA